VDLLKISLITVTYNAANTVERCLRSVINQSYPNIEYIIIDGQSTDSTLSIINNYKKYIHYIISERDHGIYDAMNKGIKMATGDIIGILNADDHFADNDVLNAIAQAFSTYSTDIVYGNINYINNEGKIIRKWRSGVYKPGHFNQGWMPPHPAFYVQRKLFNQLGAYRLSYGSATDYELMLRYIHTHKSTVHYLNKVLVNMLVGGISNKSVGNRVKAWRNDYKAMKVNGLKFPFFSIILKPLRKIIQYIR
jgi:glycosyltransferase involved in cell wall biosynthesis